MNRKDRALRELLRAHDPARKDEGPSPLDRARMRQAAVEAVRDRSIRPALVPVAAGAGLGLAVLAFLLAFWVASRPGPVPPRLATEGPTAAGLAGSPGAEVPATVGPDGSAAGAVPARQIQMTTPGGTRIVWILKS